MNKEIKSNIEALLEQYDTIAAERKVVLQKVAAAIVSTIEEKGTANILYVCTHNSRRSHFGQVAGTLAAHYFGLENTNCFSAGTEVTEMNINAVNALLAFGLELKAKTETEQQAYVFDYGGNENITCFSKRFDDKSIPAQNIIALMTCTDAEQNCPFIPAALYRIATPYQDPKSSDGTGDEATVYAERFRQILTECLYTFSLLK